MSIACLLTASTLVILLFLSTPAVSSDSAVSVSLDGDAPTAYSILQGFNFPVGILPVGVVGYDLDRSTGKFHAYFKNSCKFSLEGSYQLSYKSTISGYISENKLTKLTGVSVKVLFVWLNIVEVARNGDELQFSVGITSANFGIREFYDSPQCGCGFNCNGSGVSRIRKNPFISSF